jgi:RNA polymerase sigma factor for flagellar operon FliA
MTEPTPVPDEPGDGVRTPPAPINGARVNGARTSGLRSTVALDPDMPTTDKQHDDKQHHDQADTAPNGARTNGRHVNGRTNGAHRNGHTSTATLETDRPGTDRLDTPPNGARHANGAHRDAPPADRRAPTNGQRHDEPGQDELGHGERPARDECPGDDERSGRGERSARGERLGRAERVGHGERFGEGEWPGQGDAVEGSGADVAHSTGYDGGDGGADEPAEADLDAVVARVVNGATRRASANGHAVTFGFGETAGVLPGDQRTFDDVEAGIVALWRQFGERREQPLRDRLVLHYAPLVKYVAGRVGTGLPAHVEVADLIQSGIFGLVDAIEKFEPERGLKFETYAMQRIRGAILDDLRAQDWVPRSVRGRAREVERALERLGAKLRRTPTDGELADELGLSLTELRELYAQLQLTSVVALDELAAAGRGSTPLADILEDQEALDPVALLVDQDNRRQLAQAIAHLAERDRVVVTLYYFENLTLAEIGRVLGVTESRVCQLHTRAVLRLRAKLLEKSEV